jgi:hypothetical protein
VIIFQGHPYKEAKRKINPKRKGIKVKLSLCLIKHYAMKAYGGVDV